MPGGANPAVEEKDASEMDGGRPGRARNPRRTIHRRNDSIAHLHNARENQDRFGRPDVGGTTEKDRCHCGGNDDGAQPIHFGKKSQTGSVGNRMAGYEVGRDDADHPEGAAQGRADDVHPNQSPTLPI